MSALTTGGGWIACVLSMPAGNFAATMRACWSLICVDDAFASAWLEDPLRPDGLLLRDAALGLDDPQGGLRLETAQALIETWPQGRIFGQGGEFRWERRSDDLLDLVLTCDGAAPDPLPGGFSHPITLKRLGDEALLLWGRRKDGRWSEERIPNLPYPKVWTGPHVAIESRSYLHEANDDREYDSRIVRYCGFNGSYNPLEESY